MPRSTVRECTRTRVTKNWNARRRWDRVSFDIYSIAAKVREHSCGISILFAFLERLKHLSSSALTLDRITFYTNARQMSESYEIRKKSYYPS